MIPAGNCAEGRLVDGIDVLIPASLLELVEHLRGEKVLDVLDKEAICAAATSVYDVDFAEVRGQQVVKRALEIAAAGTGDAGTSISQSASYDFFKRAYRWRQCAAAWRSDIEPSWCFIFR